MSALLLMPAPRGHPAHTACQPAAEHQPVRRPRGVLTVVSAGDSWRVYTRESVLALAVFDTCAAAMLHARALAQRAPGTELRLFSPDGRLASREIVLAVVPSSAATPPSPSNSPAY